MYGVSMACESILKSISLRYLFISTSGRMYFINVLFTFSLFHLAACFLSSPNESIIYISLYD